MKNSTLFCALLISASLLSACAKKDAEAPAAKPAAEETVATIDGAPITKSEYEFYAKTVARRPLAELTEEQRGQVLDDLIRLHIVADTATKTGLDKEPETAAALSLARLNLLTQAAVKKELAAQPTEQEMRAAYETFVSEQPKFEYRARHILVATPEFAQSLIDKLNKGANFADLAKKESTDGSKAEGGDLGWFSPAGMVPPFAEAVMALEKGKITQKPVQTQFGWHVIKLEDSRDLQVRDYEEMKQEMLQRVQQKKVQAYLDNLKKDKKIEKTEKKA